MKMLYYENRIKEAKAVSEEQRRDGWSVDDRKKYWVTLGYDESFIKKVVTENNLLEIMPL